MNFNMMEVLSIVPRSIIALFTLFIVTKLIGKKQISELSLFDYVIGISIGNFTAEMTLNLDDGYINGVVAIFVFGFISYLVSVVTRKNVRLRRIILGVPTIIIQDGKIIEKNLKKTRLDINELLEESRLKGYFDLSEIDVAIMEVNGDISFLPKETYKNVTLKDLNIKSPNKGLVANVVIDGKIIENNLKNMNKDKEWLLKELKVKGYKKIDNIILATLDNDEKIVVYKKENNVKVYNVLE